MRTAKALARLRGYEGSPEPSLVAYAISTIISRAGSIEKQQLSCGCAVDIYLCGFVSSFHVMFWLKLQSIISPGRLLIFLYVYIVCVLCDVFAFLLDAVGRVRLIILALSCHMHM